MLQSHPFVKTFRNIYRRLPSHLQHGFWFTAGVSLLVAVLELVLALAVSLLGVSLATPEAVAQLGPVKTLTQHFPSILPVVQDQRTLLALLLLGIVGTLTLKLLASLYMYWKQGRFAQKISAYINHVLFKGYLYGSYLWHVGQETSVLQTHLGWRDQITAFMLQLLLFSTYISVTIILLASVLVTAPLVGLFVLAVTGGCGVCIYRWSRRRVARLSAELSQLSVEMNRATLPALQGIREVLIYRQQPEFLHTVDAINTQVCRLKPHLDMMPPLPALLLELVGMVMLFFSVLFMNAQGTSLAHMTATLTLMAAVAWRLLPTMNRFITCMINAQTALPYIHPVLKRIDEVQEFSGAAATEVAPCPFQHELRLEDVSFRYPETQDGKDDALRHISLFIPKGKKVGLIGSSGAGKSTIVGLLTGLFVPTAGRMTVDGTPLTPQRRAGWMESIGYVPQSTFLLNASIAQNVAFSQWGKDLDRERVRACCRMAAMDFVEDLPDGIDTRIGERGIRLSGGQVQRISIARALYNNPQMLLFDEATSALDGTSEAEIMRTVYGLDSALTVVIVAHRLSTVENCDYLYWIKDGELYAHGPTPTVLSAYMSSMQCHTEGY